MNHDQAITEVIFARLRNFQDGKPETVRQPRYWMTFQQLRFRCYVVISRAVVVAQWWNTHLVSERMWV